MEEEMVDLTVQKGDKMNPRVSRMVNEMTELTYRISSLSNFLDEHEPGDNEDGVTVNEEEYDWMINQYLMMVGYANALENRLRINGYEINVVEPPKEQDQQ